MALNGTAQYLAYNSAADGHADLLDELMSPSASARSSETELSPAQKSAEALRLVLAGDVSVLKEFFHDNPDFPINARDPDSGRSLLHEACAVGQKEIVKFLLQSTDADLMLRTMLGRCTPLHLAVTNNYRPIVFLLLSHGADALTRDRFASSPLHYAQSVSVAKLLVQYGAKVLDYNARRKNVFESVSSLLKASNPANGGSTADEATIEAQGALQKYLKTQMESEYRAKLENLRQLKQQAKIKASALAAGIPRAGKSRRRLSMIR